MRIQIKHLLVNLSLVIISVLLTCAVLEVAIRCAKGRLLDTDNQISRKMGIGWDYRLVQFDSRLGWVPKPGASAVNELWMGKKVTVLDDGSRSNGQHPGLKNRPFILAVGDSYTFGDEVSDDETWPSYLERLSGIPVVNGGVSGYGLDQIVLRAKILAGKLHPDILIVNFIRDDVYRCEYSVLWNTSKPYFDIKDGLLVLKNSPVAPLVYDAKYSWFRSIFGHSYLAHSIMIRINPGYWMMGSGNAKHVNSDGPKIARALLKELDDLAKNTGIKTLIVFLDERCVLDDYEKLTGGLKLEKSEITDITHFFAEIHGKSEIDFLRLKGRGHMSYRGNKFTADIILKKLKEAGFINDRISP